MSSGGSPVKEEGRSGASSPVMLTTMTPVSVMDYEQEGGEQHKVLYVSSAGDEGLLGLEGHPGGYLAPPGYQPPAPTVLVLSELVDDMSPILSLSGTQTASLAVLLQSAARAQPCPTHEISRRAEVAHALRASGIQSTRDPVN